MVWEGQKQAFPKLVMSYNDPAARLSDKIAKQFAPRSRCEGRIRHDIGLSGAKSRGASAAAVSRLQEHGQALALEAADSDAAHAVGIDRAGLRPRDGARTRSRPHHSGQGP